MEIHVRKKAFFLFWNSSYSRILTVYKNAHLTTRSLELIYLMQFLISPPLKWHNDLYGTHWREWLKCYKSLFACTCHVPIWATSMTLRLRSGFQYKQCSTVLSVGGLRQQFSLDENIRMSMYTAEFFSKLSLFLTVDRKFYSYRL